MSISVIVGTFGDKDEWGALAQRAIISAEAQAVEPVDVIWIHGDNLRDARNLGANRARGEWLCFLDADDELDRGYIEAMEDAASKSMARSDAREFLLQPATLGVVDGREDPFPVVIKEKPLMDGNYLIIGTLVRQAQFERVGGFADFPIYEDWDLWLRCWLDGARSISVPNAIYRVHVRPNSRNFPDGSTQIHYYNEIRSQYLGRVR